jgi:hypothetical protein
MDLGDKQRLLAGLARPRTVRLSRRGKSWIMVLACAGVAVEAGLLIYLSSRWMQVHSLGAVVNGHEIAFFAALVVPLLPFMLSPGWGKQKRLVRDGAVVIATVTWTSKSSSEVNRNDDVRMVRYQFRTDSGAQITGSSADPTFQLREGSTMLVYYDPADPGEQAAQCASYYVAMAPGLASDWLDEIG